MPFGPNCEYPDFASCVRENKGKADPEEYCAAIQRATEGHCSGGSSAKLHRFRIVNRPSLTWLNVIARRH